MKQDTPLEHAVRLLDMKLDILEGPTSGWTVGDRKTLHRMAKAVVTEFYAERGD